MDKPESELELSELELELEPDEPVDEIQETAQMRQIKIQLLFDLVFGADDFDVAESESDESEAEVDSELESPLLPIQFSVETKIQTFSDTYSELDKPSFFASKAFHCLTISSSWGPSTSTSSFKITTSLTAFFNARANFVCDRFVKKA